VGAILEHERQQRDAKLEEVRRLEGSRPEEAHPMRMAHEALTYVAHLRAFVAQGRVRALEAGSHPHKLCDEPWYPGSK